MKFILSSPVYLVSSGYSFTYQWWATIYNFHNPEFNCAFIWQFGVVVESYILQNNVIFVNVYNLYNYTLQTGVQGDIKESAAVFINCSDHLSDKEEEGASFHAALISSRPSPWI